MTWGVPSPPVQTNPIVDRRWEQCVGSLNQLNLDMLEQASLLTEKCDAIQVFDLNHFLELSTQITALATLIRNNQSENRAAILGLSDAVDIRYLKTIAEIDRSRKENQALYDESRRLVFLDFWNGARVWWSDLLQRTWIFMRRPI